MHFFVFLCKWIYILKIHQYMVFKSYKLLYFKLIYYNYAVFGFKVCLLMMFCKGLRLLHFYIYLAP